MKSALILGGGNLQQEAGTGNGRRGANPGSGINVGNVNEGDSATNDGGRSDGNRTANAANEWQPNIEVDSVWVPTSAHEHEAVRSELLYYRQSGLMRVWYAASGMCVKVEPAKFALPSQPEPAAAELETSDDDDEAFEVPRGEIRAESSTTPDPDRPKIILRLPGRASAAPQPVTPPASAPHSSDEDPLKAPLLLSSIPEGEPDDESFDVGKRKKTPTKKGAAAARAGTGSGRGGARGRGGQSKASTPRKAATAKGKAPASAIKKSPRPTRSRQKKVQFGDEVEERKAPVAVGTNAAQGQTDIEMTDAAKRALSNTDEDFTMAGALGPATHTGGTHSVDRH